MNLLYPSTPANPSILAKRDARGLKVYENPKCHPIDSWQLKYRTN